LFSSSASAHQRTSGIGSARASTPKHTRGRGGSFGLQSLPWAQLVDPVHCAIHRNVASRWY
jgi:hypothetical protein